MSTLWIALLAVQAPPFDMKSVPALMRQHCSAEWPDDFQMQDYCLKQQVEGMAQFKRQASPWVVHSTGRSNAA